MSTDRHTSVLIVGGGAVGLLLACELAARGVDTTVVEELPAVRDVPRAGTLHARTVQTLLRRGHLRLNGTGRLDEHQRFGFHFGGLSVLEIDAPTAEGPPIVNRSQADLEHLFEAGATRSGARVWRGARVVDLVEEAAGVTVSVLAADGAAHTLTADWVVGCDGARGTVRERAGITSTTTEPTFAAALGMVRLLDPASAPGGWARGPGGGTLVNVNPYGHSRVIAHDFTRPLPDRRRPVTLGELRASTARVLGRDLPMTDLAHAARYSDFTRLADGYRSPGHGRVLLAGDAAHVHAPLGGQGLNTGLQDAVNLGWKLALVARGAAPAELLDTYTAERRPVAAAVVANTRAQAAVMDPRPERAPARASVRRYLGDEEALRATAAEVSGQSITLPPTAPGAGPDLGAGWFLPNHTLATAEGPRTVAELLTAGRPLLLFVPAVGEGLADTALAWGDRLDPVPVADDPALGWNAVLCRPDGYTAWSSPTGTRPDLGALTRALTHWLGPLRHPAHLGERT
ncbi:FAD-dependent monooxygenase [Streptomyces sp. BI20]|uniref:FAD-dependent monooxygenase n=1 Tax=Streptomyces sp. BI20 TaxID=3403460 RepID=UPI003C714D36